MPRFAYEGVRPSDTWFNPEWFGGGSTATGTPAVSTWNERLAARQPVGPTTVPPSGSATGPWQMPTTAAGPASYPQNLTIPNEWRGQPDPRSTDPNFNFWAGPNGTATPVPGPPPQPSSGPLTPATTGQINPATGRPYTYVEQFRQASGLNIPQGFEYENGIRRMTTPGTDMSQGRARFGLNGPLSMDALVSQTQGYNTANQGRYNTAATAAQGLYAASAPAARTTDPRMALAQSLYSNDPNWQALQARRATSPGAWNPNAIQGPTGDRTTLDPRTRWLSAGQQRFTTDDPSTWARTPAMWDAKQANMARAQANQAANEQARTANRARRQGLAGPLSQPSGALVPSWPGADYERGYGMGPAYPQPAMTPGMGQIPWYESAANFNGPGQGLSPAGQLAHARAAGYPNGWPRRE